jgi:predicted Rossmann-fold nucleotide-binding protein
LPDKPGYPEKIVSGGQTGVDRAALDVALELGIPCGGWCPKGRRAEDGVIDHHYPLQEVSSPEYPVRTEMNVKDSDATLILNQGTLAGGTALTLKLAKIHKKPYRVVDLSKTKDPAPVRKWMQTEKVNVLNVAGPPESNRPGIYAKAIEFLRRMVQGGQDGLIGR